MRDVMHSMEGVARAHPQLFERDLHPADPTDPPPVYSLLRIYASTNIIISVSTEPQGIMTMEPQAMFAAAEKASELLKSLANRHRLLIVCQLIDGERSVGELTAFLGIRDSTVSQHLALLRKDGVVAARREGQTIFYSIASASAREVLEALYRHYCAPEPLSAAQDPQ